MWWGLESFTKLQSWIFINTIRNFKVILNLKKIPINPFIHENNLISKNEHDYFWSQLHIKVSREKKRKNTLRKTLAKRKSHGMSPCGFWYFLNYWDVIIKLGIFNSLHRKFLTMKWFSIRNTERNKVVQDHSVIIFYTWIDVPWNFSNRLRAYVSRNSFTCR